MSDVSGQRHEREDGTLWEWVGDIQFKSYAQMRPYIGDFSGTKTNPSLYKLKPAHTLSGLKIRAWATGQAEIAFMGNVYGVPIPQIPVFSNSSQWKF